MNLSDNCIEKLNSQFNICENDEIIHVVNKLRFLMIGCRKESRISIDEACKLIQIDKKKSARYFAYNILRTLEEVLGKKPIFRNPGEKNLSFDEQWITSLITSYQSNDQMSIKFLINSRVENLNKRSYISFLIDGLVKDLNSL
ncbi:MAG: hypothetical protein ACJ0DD_06805 [Paracoccaceae bacterium]|tara:strand:+ start:267 stop:695 length:429 start_codon:yes stop_codon:yes gene_type:complete